MPTAKAVDDDRRRFRRGSSRQEILGVGLGGFIDGILLHQLLQWHHMLTSTDSDNVGIDTYPADTVHGLQIHTVWDGLFHTFTWLCVLVGLGMLYSRVTHSRGRVWASRVLWGWILMGWGQFNLVEGVIDHHLLGIHHVRSGPNPIMVGPRIPGPRRPVGPRGLDPDPQHPSQPH